MKGISRTAIGVGILRAAHRMLDDEPWLIDDPVSVALFGEAVRSTMESEPDWVFERSRIDMRGHVLVRSKFAEARLRAAVERGVRQVVALGAGYDTLAFRQAPWMDGTRLFEVDALVTQTDKRERIARAGYAEPQNVQFVPVDFERDTLGSALAQAGFDVNAPAFFSWLGVMVYLTRPAIDEVFRYVAALPRESEIAFTFAERRHHSISELSTRVAAVGEPFVTHMDAEEIAPMLRAFGFRETIVPTLDETWSWLGTRSDTLSIPNRRCLASAVV